MSWVGFRLMVRVELSKWGSVPLRAYREGVKSVNVKRGEWRDHQELQVERAFMKPSHQEEIHQTHPKGNKTLNYEMLHLKGISGVS